MQLKQSRLIHQKEKLNRVKLYQSYQNIKAKSKERKEIRAFVRTIKLNEPSFAQRTKDPLPPCRNRHPKYVNPLAAKK